ncbi:MAG: hypothetical protein ACHQ9S_21705 [Candidatus Binatia bacterium]
MILGPPVPQKSLRTALVACLALVAPLAACRPDETTSLGIAERFVDQHYVRIDLEAAKPFCTGLALKKLQNEQQLTQGQAIDESTRKPTVRYRLVQKTDEADHGSFVFEGTIQVEDAGQFSRKWLVSTRREGDLWKVSNFEEFD